MGVRPVYIFLLMQCGDRLWTPESDAYRQILTSKVYPRAVRINPYSAGIDFSRQNLTSVYTSDSYV